MVKVDQIQKIILRARRLPYLAVALALLFLASAILFTTHLLRNQIRAQIASRDGVVLYAVASMHTEAVAKELAELTDLGLGELSSLEEPANQLMVLLRTSSLNQVIGARLFDPRGRFVECFPAHVLEARLPLDDLAIIQELKPVSHFHPEVPLRDLFYPESDELLDPSRTLPLLEVNVPLHKLDERKLLGVAQFLIEGHGLGAELARLDRNLLLLASVAFIGAGSLLAVTLGNAFRRLRKTQDLLTERTQNLLQANQELALAAKSSAVGAVTAHLIHGLKNPLSGLQSFVTSLGSAQDPADGPEWEQAIASTRRMQSLINEIVQVLREQEGTSHYEIRVKELLDIVEEKTKGLARQKEIQFISLAHADAVLTSREANLVTLILVNLIQNAIQVTPNQGRVNMKVDRADTGLAFEIHDQGPGFPEALRTSLFQPCPTDKEGGSGIGLAISKLLANHLQASLELQDSSPNGCVFKLTLPETVFSK